MEDLLERRRMLIRQSASVDPYLLQPFTIEFVDSGSTILSVGDFGINDASLLTNLKINKNNTGWVSYTYNSNDGVFEDGNGNYELPVTQGDIIQIKATGAWNDSTSDGFQIYQPYPQKKCNFSGNIMSLIHGDNFVGATTVPDYGLSRIFGTNANINGMTFGCVDASNLKLPATQIGIYAYNQMFYYQNNLLYAPEILPATTLSQRCYNQMFYYCGYLQRAPILPALELVDRCYFGMFGRCSQLKYIKAMFLTTPGTGLTNNWVSGVASSGTFVKNSAATWNVSGNNGVPSGWTIQYASS